MYGYIGMILVLYWRRVAWLESMWSNNDIIVTAPGIYIVMKN